MLSSRLISGVMLLSVMLCSCAKDKPLDSNSGRSHVISVPGAASTIQAALDLGSDCDTVLVAPGEYTGPGNYELDFAGKAITLRSAAGPLETVINVGGTLESPRRAFDLSSGEDSSTIIEGFTIRNGYNSSAAAMQLLSASPLIRHCIFVDNWAAVSGGAIRCKNSSPRLENCTFVANYAPTGAAVFCIATSSPVFENCIFAYNREGSAFYVSDAGSQPTLDCCNLFDNEGGDWLTIEDQVLANQNMSLAPGFCSLATDDFRLHNDSPCLPANNDCGELVGAVNVTCD